MKTSREISLRKKTMSRNPPKAIHFARRGGLLLYDGAQGKTVEGIRISQGDQAIFVVIEFTDRTELAITLNSLPAVAVSLSAPMTQGDEDLEAIAESRRTLLPNLSLLQWDQIEKPPVERKLHKR
jgi:hypothetical protein